METQLRKLARSNSWQTLYSANKNCSGIKLFDNDSSFSDLQIRFLYWLEIYSMLYTELATKEDKFLTEAVINDEMRCLFNSKT